MENEVKQHKWDKKSWIVGTAGGFIALLMLLPAFEQKAGGTHALEVCLVLLSVLLIFIALPVYLTATSRRKWILWPYLPWLIWLVGMIVATGFSSIAKTSGSSGESDDISDQTGKIILISMLLAPLLMSLPIAFGRLFLYRSRRNKAAEIVFNEVGPVQDDVWPPRPNVE